MPLAPATQEENKRAPRWRVRGRGGVSRLRPGIRASRPGRVRRAKRLTCGWVERRWLACRSPSASRCPGAPATLGASFAPGGTFSWFSRSTEVPVSMMAWLTVGPANWAGGRRKEGEKKKTPAHWRYGSLRSRRSSSPRLLNPPMGRRLLYVTATSLLIARVKKKEGRERGRRERSRGSGVLCCSVLVILNLG